ncbi:hypothetical protein E8E13_005586 [Curvularia kusanoi]|uniref:Clr5 domain-containing protein n=1 Tax=Curvularia kusanoi TaxID=90978 RepID=A0A9P4TKS8_CURKU|nr:hypothetical protein E8E13_005586 [Curvularia kusanoi]
MSSHMTKLQSKQRGRKIPDEQWNDHRSRILRLWLHDGEEGRSLKEVADIMERKYGFVATTSQFHNRLIKKWHVRKYITKSEWQRLFWDEMDRRPAETIRVYFNKRLIPPETKEREWERYGFALEVRPQDLINLSETFRYEIVSTTPGMEDLVFASSTALLGVEHQACSGGPAWSLTSHVPYPPQVSYTIPHFFNLHPFSWANGIDWATLSSRARTADQQIIRLIRPNRSQFMSMSYPEQQTSLTVSLEPDALILRHIVFSIVNGIESSRQTDSNGIYLWLANLSRRTVQGFFASLPIEILNVIRQRIRAKAVRSGDPDVAKTLLSLERDLNPDCPYSSGEISKLLEPLSQWKCDIAFAHILVIHSSCVCSDQDMVLRELSLAYNVETRRAFSDDKDWVSLISIPLLAGAEPMTFCFLVARYDIQTLEQLLEASNRDILSWMEAGLLTAAVNKSNYLSKPEDAILLDWVFDKLSAEISSQTLSNSWTDTHAAAVSSTCSRAFVVSLQKHDLSSTKTLHDNCQSLGLTLVYTQYDRTLNDRIMSYCMAGDWSAAYKAAEIPTATITSSPFSESLTEAIVNDDYRRVRRELDESRDRNAFKIAIESASDNVAAFIAARTRPWAVLRLLERGNTRAISNMLSYHSHWADILQKPFSTRDHEQLEHILYHKQQHNDCHLFPCQIWADGSRCRQQIVLRALGYHAIDTCDLQLLDWVRKQDLAMGGVVVQVDGGIQGILPSLDYRQGRLLDEVLIADDVNLPSFFNVAVQHNALLLMNYFCSLTPTHKHSDALLHAVKTDVELITIKYLIEREGLEGIQNNKQYGSAALRIAIRNRNYDLVRLLAEITDIHGLEPINWEDAESERYRDPLGEAIFQGDIEAVNILLDNGGNPNALVAFEGLPRDISRVADYSVLLRLTALLAAIDIGSFDLTKILIERGADVNGRLDMGLLRTPLQRAAEIGDFEMVQFLVQKDAIVDSEPAFGGGTALQLAAMSGHVGIATFLMQHGADVNHPPARGPGRTAFEAAAEWCRPDMMYLLVQNGAQLDLDIFGDVEELVYDSSDGYGSDDSESDQDSDSGWRLQCRTVKVAKSQYSRAMEFAENRQESASMAIVQSIYDKVVKGTS